MSIRSIPRGPEDYYDCSYCGAKPNSPCHDKNGNIRGPHKARKDAYYGQFLGRDPQK